MSWDARDYAGITNETEYREYQEEIFARVLRLTAYECDASFREWQDGHQTAVRDASFGSW